MHLDGEVWAGRGQFAAASRAVNHGRWQPHVCFMVFDAPEEPGAWPERLARAAAALSGSQFAATVPWTVIRDMDHVAQLVRRIRLGGGEGLVLIDPTASGYHVGRTDRALKLKCDPFTGELAWQPERWARNLKSRNIAA